MGRYVFSLSLVSVSLGPVRLGLEVGLQHEVEDAATAEVDVLDGVAHRSLWLLKFFTTSCRQLTFFVKSDFYLQ